MDSVRVIGLPFAGGQPRPGVAAGPRWIRRQGLRQALWGAGRRVEDQGDLADLAPARMAVGAALEQNWRIARHLRDTWGQAGVSLNLGGDHGVGLGTVAATLMRHRDAGVIWVDAHGDINTPETSPTGNFHGMPLAALLGLIRPRSIGDGRWSWRWSVPLLDPSRLVLVGPRDLDEGEREAIARLGIRVFGSDSIRALGIRRVMERALGALEAAGAGCVHLSFDIDAMDPLIAPSTGTPVAGGLSREQGLEICRAVSESGRLAAMDLVELNADIDPSRAPATAAFAVELIARALDRPYKPAYGGQPWRATATSFWA